MNVFINPDEYESDSGDKLRRVAKYHRWVIVAIALLLSMGILNVSLAMTMEVDALTGYLQHPLLEGVHYILFAFSLVAIFMLTWELINIYAALACVLVLVVPNPYGGYLFMPLLIAAYLLGSRHLKQWSLRIGLFGVDPNSL